MNNIFRTRLKIARKAKNLTQAQLAEKIGTYKNKIIDTEAGFTNIRFTIEEIIKIINILEVSADWLLGTEHDTKDISIDISSENYRQLIKALDKSIADINNIKRMLN